jgi:uncharacterized protein (TIGR02285 family)
MFNLFLPSKRTTILIALASIFIASSAQASQITWYKPEFPPLSIVNGPDAGKGYSDKIENYLIANLDEYDHKVLVSPFKRTVRDMKKGVNGCSVTLLKTPQREAFIKFTRPARLLLPNSLIVRKDDVRRFQHLADEEGKISVEKVIQSGKLRIGYSNGRSYTKPLDALLQTYKGSSILVERLGNEGPKGLLSMLNKGHIDAMFAQPVEAQFHGRAEGLADKFAVLPIAEIRDYTVGYIGCSDTEWGREVIAKIDLLLEDAVKQPDFRAFYEEFLDDASRARYRKIYNEFFGLNP